jgi:hypothetical protein
MLHYISDLTGATIKAKDGDLGHVEELYFDDENWTIRYLVVDTAPLFFGKRVLISPFGVEKISWDQSAVSLSLTVNQIKESPEIDTQMPVSREQELVLSQHYQWPVYWGGQDLWGLGADPLTSYRLARESREQHEEHAEDFQLQSGENHLRSTKEVLGYTVRARDDDIGPMKDISVEDNTWTLRYIVVSTGSLFLSDRVMLGVDWIEEVSWTDSEIAVDLPIDAIKKAPELDATKPLSREYESRLVRHYKRTGYWE